MNKWKKLQSQIGVKGKGTPPKSKLSKRVTSDPHGFVKFGRALNSQVSGLAKSHQSKADFGYGGFQRGNEAHDRVQREAWPGQFAPRSAYSYILGDPPQLSAGDAVGARGFMKRIELAMEKGGWTRNEWRRLRKMYVKWRDRAEGKDLRFNTVGNKQGGLNRAQSTHVGIVNSIRTIGIDIGNGD